MDLTMRRLIVCISGSSGNPALSDPFFPGQKCWKKRSVSQTLPDRLLFNTHSSFPEPVVIGLIRIDREPLTLV
jgi:hypothetical protein